VSPLKLPQIRATSPTLAETMRACFLRAGLSRATASSKFVLGNPKAWLGTAYHEVLEVQPLQRDDRASELPALAAWTTAHIAYRVPRIKEGSDD
jgi:hypothetical protein